MAIVKGVTRNGPFADSKGDPFGGLDGKDRNAYAALVDVMRSYGLGSLAPDIMRMLQEGFGQDVIAIQLQETPAYKKRFAANEARRKKGLPVLTPAEYLATETQYRQIMRASGVPKGFYDTNEDFEKFLVNDVSPQELQQRVTAASQFVNNASPQAKQMFSKWYTKGDLIAYALDPKRAEPLIEKRLSAATIGGAAKEQGVGIGQGTATDLAELGVTGDQALAGFGQIAGDRGDLNKLADISGEERLSTSDLIRETFKQDQRVTKKRQRLASQERARFSGSSGVGSDSLSQSQGGQL